MSSTLYVGPDGKTKELPLPTRRQKLGKARGLIRHVLDKAALKPKHYNKLKQAMELLAIKVAS